MKERLICAALIIPAFINCYYKPKSEKAEEILRVASGTLLLLAACYLGVVLPQ